MNHKILDCIYSLEARLVTFKYVRLFQLFTIYFLYIYKYINNSIYENIHFHFFALASGQSAALNSVTQLQEFDGKYPLSFCTELQRVKLLSQTLSQNPLPNMHHLPSLNSYNLFLQSKQV